MFLWWRKMFSPTVEEIMEKEKKQAEKLYVQVYKNLVAWARNPVGIQVRTYIGPYINNRVEGQLVNKLQENILTKYNCSYHFARDNYLILEVRLNTDKLVLDAGN